MKNSEIKTIFFDLGNVLIDFDHSLMWSNLSKLCKTSEKNLQDIINFKNLWTKYEKGLIDINFFISEIENSLGVEISHKQFITEAQEIFFANDEMRKILKSLHQKDYELFLISNTCDIHFEYVKREFDIVPYFKKVLLSYELHLAKPEKEIFHHALSLTSSKPNQCLYVDDLIQHIESAKKLGISCHVFKDAKGLKKTLHENGINV